MTRVATLFVRFLRPDSARGGWPGRGHGAATSRSADRGAGAAAGQGASGGRRAPGGGAPGSGGEREEGEDFNALIVNTLNRCMSGLGLDASDID